MRRASSLKDKEVINVSDGTRLGMVSDVEINLNDGRIEGIVVPIQGKWFGLFGKDNEYIIPWESIIKVGDEIILVEMSESIVKKFLE
ncbi:YlmC/YmxH family sporulation protein [Ruminiclostridium cellulolyticum]|uniref:Sporulation protein, YlmC/YmxH family n=1 Tax=Ruminiclostridium cellulolyticum (strain ATCC 35319 / DSM 5812 / JCM 6584 / H10) TaxID=394503 RepID=B8I3X3_RUMCH|nr:YlmC/YmxH family sporulation protein [Ruminiclostridium cellulolyticum]ACL76406.1 sporulation protein, YlmC/YmxH family [Ruminiclostridium cellulolyticum H10]